MDLAYLWFFIVGVLFVGYFVLDGFDTALTDVSRGWADPLGWPVDAAHAIGLVTAPFWSALAAAALVVALLLTHHRAAAGLLAMLGLAGHASANTNAPCASADDAKVIRHYYDQVRPGASSSPSTRSR